MDRIKPFKCNICAKCCTNFRGRLGENGIKREILPNIYEYTSRFRASIVLHEWEVTNLGKKAIGMGFDLKAVPYLVVWDDISRQPLTLVYTIDYDNCPFLSERNLCNVNEDKPLICRAYPLFLNNLFEALESRKKIDLDHGDCPNYVRFGHEDESSDSQEIHKVRSGQFFKMVFDAYGDCFTAVLQRREASRITADLFLDLVRRAEIYPEIIAQDTIERIKKTNPIGLLEFARKHSFPLFKEAESEIREIYKFDSNKLEEMLSLAKK